MILIGPRLMKHAQHMNGKSFFQFMLTKSKLANIKVFSRMPVISRYIKARVMESMACEGTYLHHVLVNNMQI